MNTQYFEPITFEDDIFTDHTCKVGVNIGKRSYRPIKIKLDSLGHVGLLIDCDGPFNASHEFAKRIKRGHVITMGLTPEIARKIVQDISKALEIWENVE